MDGAYRCARCGAALILIIAAAAASTYSCPGCLAVYDQCRAYAPDPLIPTRQVAIIRWRRDGFITRSLEWLPSDDNASTSSNAN